MRAPILSAFAAAATALLFALPAAAHDWVDREESVVTVRECPLPAPASQHHVGRIAASHRRRAHAAVRCQVAEATPVEEHVVRIYHREDVEDCAGRDRCTDRDHDRWRERDWRGAERDRDMDQDHGMAMSRDDGDRYGARRDDGDRAMRDDHDMGMRRDDGDRRMWDDHARAFVDGSVHREEEDRRGWDDHEYAQRDSGMHRDVGEARAHVYFEERERTFERGERWIDRCGCGPARPTATDDDGYLVWAGKVDRDDRSWDVHP